jgi:hypothetical protein
MWIGIEHSCFCRQWSFRSGLRASLQKQKRSLHCEQPKRRSDRNHAFPSPDVAKLGVNYRFGGSNILSAEY